MRRTDALFQLIKSLNRAEKRNFRLLTQLTSGDKKYAQLFDAIDRQSVYDEQKIIRQVKDVAFTRQFSVAKNYLYNNILRSLGYFYKGPQAEVSSMMLQVQILREKNLVPHALKILRKTKEKASQAERFHDLLQILQVERETLFETSNYKKFGMFVQDIQREEQAAMAKLSNLQAYQEIFDDVVQKTKTSFEARSAMETDDFRSVLGHPLMQSEDSALSIKARVMYQIILDYIYRYKGEFDKCIDCAIRAIELLETNDTIREELIMRYVNEVHNLSLYFLNRRDVEESRRVILKLVNLNPRSDRARTNVFVKYYIQAISQAHVTGDTDFAMRELARFEEELPAYQAVLYKPDELLLYYVAARVCLTAGEFSWALKWINRFLNEPRTEIRSDLQCFARILNLVIHYEMGNMDVLEHNLKSTYRFIFKRDRIHKTERAVLRFIRDLTMVKTRESLMQLFEKLLRQLQEFVSDPMEGPANRQLDLSSWLKAKIEGVPLAVIKQRQFEHSLEERKKRLAGGARY